MLINELKALFNYQNGNINLQVNIYEIENWFLKKASSVKTFQIINNIINQIALSVVYYYEVSLTSLSTYYLSKIAK